MKKKTKTIIVLLVVINIILSIASVLKSEKKRKNFAEIKYNPEQEVENRESFRKVPILLNNL